MTIFSLPSGLNEELRRFCVDNIQHLPEALENHPNNLFDFVVQVYNEKKTWQIENFDLGQRLVMKLHDTAFQARLSPEKIQSIQRLQEEILQNPLAFKKKEIAGSLNFSKALHIDFEGRLASIVINDENLSFLLSIAYRAELKLLMDSCLKYIADQKGYGVSLLGRYRFRINIQNLVIDTEDFKKILALLPNKDIIICLLTQEDQNLEELEKFTLEFGEKISIFTLSLMKNRIDNDLLLKLTKNCPNIDCLSIESENITSEGLDNLWKLTNISTLSLDNCKSLTELPADIGNLINLKELNLINCSGLKSLPKELCNLPNLKKLSINGCAGFLELNPEDIPFLMQIAYKTDSETLIYLCLNQIMNASDLVINYKEDKSLLFFLQKITDIEAIKKSIELLPNKNFKIAYNPEADANIDELLSFSEQFGENIVSLKLYRLDINNDNLHRFISNCPHVTDLIVSTSPHLSSAAFNNLHTLTNLQELVIVYSENFKELPIGIAALRNLQELDLSGCTNLSVISQLKVLFSMMMIDKVQANTLMSSFLIDPLLLTQLYLNGFSKLSEQDQRWFLELMPRMDSENECAKLLYILQHVERGSIDLIKEELLNDVPIDFVLSICVGRRPELSLAIKDSLREGTLYDHWIAYRLGCTLEEEINSLSLFKSCFDNPLYQKQNLIMINFLLDDPIITLSLTENLLTDEARQILIDNRVAIHSMPQAISSLVKELYPPENPENARYYPLIIRGGNVSCAADLPLQEPVETLNELALAIKKDKLIAIAVAYLGHEGHDSGALRRDFLSKLFKALSKKFGLEDRIPSWTDQTDSILQNIGTVWHILLQKEPIPVGAVFHPDFFRNALKFDYDDITKDFAEILSERLFKIAFEIPPKTGAFYDYAVGLNALLSWDASAADLENGNPHLNFMQMVESLLGIEMPEGKLDAQKIATYQNLLRDEYLERYRQQYHSLHSIAKGIHCGKKDWKGLQMHGHEIVQNYIQGAFDKELLFSSFAFRAGVTDEMQNWILDWINTKSEDDLKGFLQYVYGSPIIPPDGIKVFALERTTNEANELVTASTVHSCFAQITFPAAIEKDTLLALFDSYCAAGYEVYNTR